MNNSKNSPDRLPSLWKVDKFFPVSKYGYVYYVSDGNGRVKIGWSQNPRSRINEQAKTWIPDAKLLATEYGKYGLEKKRHRQFKDEHLILEWFILSQRLEEFIQIMKVARRLILRPGTKSVIQTEEEMFYTKATQLP